MHCTECQGHGSFEDIEWLEIKLVPCSGCGGSGSYIDQQRRVEESRKKLVRAQKRKSQRSRDRS